MSWTSGCCSMSWIWVVNWLWADWMSQWAEWAEQHPLVHAYQMSHRWVTEEFWEHFDRCSNFALKTVFSPIKNELDSLFLSFLKIKLFWALVSHLWLIRYAWNTIVNIHRFSRLVNMTSIACGVLERAVQEGAAAGAWIIKFFYWVRDDWR